MWQVEFYWIVLADDPDKSFIARLTGTLDTTTGAVEMTGKVTEAGQLRDATTSNFTGTIRVVVVSDPYQNMGGAAQN